VLGQDFYGDRTVLLKKAKFENAMKLLGDSVEVYPEGFASDKRYPDIVFVPEDAEFNVRQGTITWTRDGAARKINLRPRHDYVLPSGYKIRLQKQTAGTSWRLVGSVAHGTLCHKPCTVSGGGKSEISKSLATNILRGPVFVHDYAHDMEWVEKILTKDFSTIYKGEAPERARRTILSPERSLGSVIKLLTPSQDYTDDHNQWIRELPQTIRQLVFTIKRYYRQEWGTDWREHFTVDHINGFRAHELKYENQVLVGNYLRVGYDPREPGASINSAPTFIPRTKCRSKMTLPRPSSCPAKACAGSIRNTAMRASNSSPIVSDSCSNVPTTQFIRALTSRRSGYLRSWRLSLEF
jgi:hypothetical protein